MQSNNLVTVDGYTPTVLKVYLVEVGLETIGVNQTRYFLKPETQADPEVAALLSTKKNVFITGVLVTFEQHMRDTRTSQTWTSEVACGQQYLEHIYNVMILDNLVNNVNPDPYWSCLLECKESLEKECLKLGIYEPWINKIRYDNELNQIFCEIPMAEKYRELYVKRLEESQNANIGLNIQNSNNSSGSSLPQSYRSFFSPESGVYQSSNLGA